MNKKLFLLTLCLAGLFPNVVSLQAQPFAYTNEDVMVGFRRGGSTYDIEIDLGPLSVLKAIPAGTTVTYNTINGTLLSSLFGANIDSLQFAAFACNTFPYDPTYANQTIWATRPRPSATVQSTPWVRKSTSVTQNIAGKMQSIGLQADSYSSVELGGTTSSTNQPNLVVVLDGSNKSYGTLMGNIASGNFGNSFQGDAENITPAGFAAGSQSVYSDFYELPPSTSGAAGTYLGYFQLTPAGVFSFTAAGGNTPPTQPVLAITRTANTSTIQFNSQSSVTYTLYFTNSAGLRTPVASWPFLTPVTGTGSAMNITDTTTDGTRLYLMKAQ